MKLETKKDDHVIALLFKILPSQGFEPRTNGLCLPATPFAAFDHAMTQSLWSGLSLRFTRLPSSLYTFLAFKRDLARDYLMAFAL
jgi:hypothetical protein